MTARRLDRIWLAGGAVVVVLLLIVGWLFLAGPQLSKRASLEQQTIDTQQSNTMLAAKVAKLRDQAAHLSGLTAQLTAARAQLPAGDGLGAFTDQLTTQARAAGLTVDSVTPAVPVKITPATPAPQPGTAGSAGTTSSGTAGAGTSSGTAGAGTTSGTAGTGTTSGTAGTGTTSGGGSQPAAGSAGGQATQAGPAGQLFSIPVTVVTEGPVAGQRAFLAALQGTGPRAALVTSDALAPLPAVVGPKGKVTATNAWKMTLQVNVFVAPQAPQQVAALAKALSARRAG